MNKATNCLIIVFFVSITLAVIIWQTDLNQLVMNLKAARIELDSSRLLLMAGLISLWRPLIAWRSRQLGLNEARVHALFRHRWTLALVLLTVELVLVQNLLGLLWKSLL